MQITHWRRHFLLALFVALTSVLPLSAQTYRVTRLAPFAGSSAAGNSINNLSWVTGTSTIDASDSVIHAALWAYGLKFNLGTLGGPNSAVLWPNKNNRGVIAGVSETADIDTLGEDWSCSAFFPPPPTHHVCRGFVWRFGKMTKLSTLGGINSYAAGDNNSGQIVGWAENSTHDSTCSGTQVLQFEAVQWEPGTNRIHELHPLHGDPDGAATAINEEGQVVGISGLCDVAVGATTARHMVLWNHGVPTEIKNLGGSAWNTPTAINNHGEVVGFSDLPGDSAATPNFHAFYWSKKTGTIDLGTLPGDFFSEALGINNHGVIVGESCNADFSICRAFRYQDGMMVDLNQRISSKSSLYLLYANDINDYGRIAGGAQDSANNTTPAYLLIPDRDGDYDGDTAEATVIAPVLSESARRAIALPRGLKLPQRN